MAFGHSESVMYLVSKLTCYFFFQNRLQANRLNTDGGYKVPGDLMFTDIIILGMDKQPDTLTVLQSNGHTSTLNFTYSNSIKVGDCSILHGQL